MGLNGRTAAYAEEVEGGAQGYSYVVTAVVALRSRRVVFTHQYYGTESSGRFPVDAADLALCRNGRVAFIGGFRLFGPPPMEMSQLLEVRLSVGRGTVLLDRGPHVEAGSLRATDRHLDWRTDGAVKAVRVGCPAPTASVRVPDAPFG